VNYIEQTYGMKERHACRLLAMHRSTHRYQQVRSVKDEALRKLLKELAAKRIRFGYRRLGAAPVGARVAGEP
jgi:hypothetical protein